MTTAVTKRRRRVNVRARSPFFGTLVPAAWIKDPRLDDTALGALVRLHAATEREAEADVVVDLEAYETLRDCGYIDPVEGFLRDPFANPAEELTAGGGA